MKSPLQRVALGRRASRRVGPQPFSDVPGPEPHACGDPVMRNEIAGGVAINRLRADCEQRRHFFCSQEIGAAIQAIKNIGWIRESRGSIRILGAVRPTPLNPRRDSIALPARSATHGNGCTRRSPACQTIDSEQLQLGCGRKPQNPSCFIRHQSAAAVRTCGRPQTTENSGNKRELTGSQV